MKVSFYGAAGTVTGSKFVIEHGGIRVMVDCGLFQGLKELRLRNWEALPLEFEDIDAIVLTHGHIDHSGYIPRLVKLGFAGSIYCSEPTLDLCEVLLPDCGRLNEEDAEYANRKGFSKHKPALPLYSEQDAQVALRRFRAVPVEREFDVGGLKFCFYKVGHILGACSVVVDDGQKSMVFSGDIGRYHDLLEMAPSRIPGADVVAMETTYGDRLHDKEDPIQVVADIVQRTVHRQGILLIPSFAVGRTQTLLYCLHQAFKRGWVERVPVYVNSPMATKVTRLYQKYPDWHRLSAEQCDEAFSIANFVSSVEESMALNRKKGPMVIISASGMLTGGRVLHHLKEIGPHARHTILLPGYQAQGTRGAQLAAGAKSVKVHGMQVPIQAEVVQLDLYSAHADRDELLKWYDALEKKPETLFLIHGEAASRRAFAEVIGEKHKGAIMQPVHGESFEF